MANGDIEYGRFPITLDSNGDVDIILTPVLSSFFPETDYDNIVSKIVPISGSSGKSNAVMVVFARKTT